MSKVLIYQFHRDYGKNKYGNTESLMYESKTEDVYECCSKDKEVFYFSNYSAKSKYYNDSNEWWLVK